MWRRRCYICKKCRKVELWLCSQFSRKEIRIEALEVPQKSGNIVTIPHNFSRDIPEDIPIADSSHNVNKCKKGISLLIGAEHYSYVVSGNEKHVKTVLMAVHTMLGWNLQGCTSATTLTAVYSSVKAVTKVIITDTKESSTQLRSF